MGMIEGVPIPNPVLDPDFLRRVIVKLDDTVEIDYIDYDNGDVQGQLNEVLPRWPELREEFGDLALRRLFVTLSPDEIAELIAVAREQHPGYTRNLLTYFAIDVPAGIDPHGIVRVIASWGEPVEGAYLETLPVAPPALISPDPARNPRLNRQVWHKIVDTHVADFPSINPAAFSADGIGSRYAWCFSGGDGAGVQFVDIEQGWDFDHEDLEHANFRPGNPKGDKTPWGGVNEAFFGHGTAVLGELFAVPNNERGGTGIVPAASGMTFSERTASGGFNSADAIAGAVGLTNPGDVILLESQAEVLAADGETKRTLPREVEPAVFDATLLASLNERIVVAAAANGDTSLDEFPFLPHFVAPDWPTAPFGLFTDSRAIIVGAAEAGTRKRAYFSNYGARVDCFARGRFVDTTGSGADATGHQQYTGSLFDGTSASTPIVAGAIIAIQGILKSGCRDSTPFTVMEMRTVLHDATLNTPSLDPVAFPIGLMPDLYSIITKRLQLEQGVCPADGADSDVCFGYALPA
jgi:Subtilase family